MASSGMPSTRMAIPSSSRISSWISSLTPMNLALALLVVLATLATTALAAPPAPNPSLAVASAATDECDNAAAVAERILQAVQREAAKTLEALLTLRNIHEAGETLDDATAWLVRPQDMASANMDVLLTKTYEQGLPLIFVDLSHTERLRIFVDVLRVPIRQVSQGDSALLLLDTVSDEHGAKHYRVIHLPSGAGENGGKGDAQDFADNRDTHQVVLGSRATTTHQKYRHESVIDTSGRTIMNSTRIPMYTDAKALARHPAANPSAFELEIVRDITAYLRHCGGQRDAAAEIAECWRFLNAEMPGSDGTKVFENGMIPEEGAVWRELIETSYRSWTVQWGAPYPFSKEQIVGHRLNTYWYIYIQAPPFSQLYYAFVLVDGIHNSGMQLDSPSAIGIYLSNMDITIHATKQDQTSDPSNIFWIKSSPSTINTRHEEGRTVSSTDSYSVNINLGFDAKAVSGQLGFGYTKSFTSSYSESREITDWSIVENTDPGESLGKWKYYQTWPTDMLANSLGNFPTMWEQYFEKAWDPCKVKLVPSLSRFSLTTHNSMVWAIKPTLRSADGRSLPVRFNMTLAAKASAHACEVYDGHHKLYQSWGGFDDMAWEVNVADLNNIQWA